MSGTRTSVLPAHVNKLARDVERAIHGGAATEVARAGLLDTANERIGSLTERLAASNKYLEGEIDRILGPLPESGDAARQNQPTDPGSANDLHYRLSILEGVADALMATTTRVRAL